MRCYRCSGWVYNDYYQYPRKVEKWCLMCGTEQFPEDFKPLPYLAHLDESVKQDWAIDKYGDIVDVIDAKIEQLVQSGKVVTATAAARFASCSTSEARITLDRLLRNKDVEFLRYGPQNRWSGYRKIMKDRI